MTQGERDDNLIPPAPERVPQRTELFQAYGDRYLQEERQPNRGNLDSHLGVQVAPGPDYHAVVVRRVCEHGVGRRIHPRPGMSRPDHLEPPTGALRVRVGYGPDTESAGVDGLHRGDYRGSPVSEPDHREPRHACWIKYQPRLIATPITSQPQRLCLSAHRLRRMRLETTYR